MKRNSRTFFYGSLSSILGLLTALLLTGSLSFTARAQPAVSISRPPLPASPTWKANIAEQLAGSLKSHNAAIREAAFLNTLHFARNYGDEVDLASVVPALLDAYEFNRFGSGAERLLALAALHAIGNEYGMRRLAEHVARERFTCLPRRERYLRRLTLAALADHVQRKEREKEHKKEEWLARR